MKNKMTFVLFVMGIFSAALLTTGCQTVQGAGQDIENAGDALEDAVD